MTNSPPRIFLGRGTFATVVKTRNPDSRWVARKTFSDFKFFAAERDILELVAARSCNCPDYQCIVQAVEWCDMSHLNKESYIDFELACGSLRQPSRCSTLQSAAGVTSAIASCLRGLQHLHNIGICHCDVKPANILHFSSGRIVIADLGCAKLNNAPNIQKLSAPTYAAPELFYDGCDERCRSDVFSLGVTWYWILEGRRPYNIPLEVDRVLKAFSTETDHNQVRLMKLEVLKGMSAAIRDFVPEAPKGCEVPQLSVAAANLVALLLVKDYEQRPTASEALQILVEDGSKKMDVSEATVSEATTEEATTGEELDYQRIASCTEIKMKGGRWDKYGLRQKMQIFNVWQVGLRPHTK